jgi:hypothetical protein
MLIIESEGHCNVANYPKITAEICNGCDKPFGPEDIFEALVDRVRKRSYLIHPNCWEILEAKLKGGSNGNLPSWAKL